MSKFNQFDAGKWSEFCATPNGQNLLEELRLNMPSLKPVARDNVNFNGEDYAWAAGVRFGAEMFFDLLLKLRESKVELVEYTFRTHGQATERGE